ncbi:hypothetical protein [Pseudomonas citronellolis]|uniref:hypothetical protein n=1 Tax=Pseudomonas citronellolis TaxID=53408 RepID=UPI0023E39AAD|nr:hypothetical protein [Pseudomonas citronellolis]MDF3931402.1 hypothetical protein [Pseudomonas citronellolis]
MADRSNSATLAADIRAITGADSQQRKQLKTLEPRGALEEKRGRADYVEPAAAAASGGIASPLTESSFLDREYWADKVITSTDGLFSFKIKPIKSIHQVDANNAEVIQQFAQPVVSS